MSITLKHDFKFVVDEVPALLLDLIGSNPTLTHKAGATSGYANMSGELTSSTTTAPQFAVEDVFSDRRALSAGALTLDLTSLVSTLGVAKDFTGKKVKGIIIVPNKDNTAGIVVKDGATNPYLIWGSATGEITAWPGEPIAQLFGNNLAAVSATVKTIDFSSSDTDAEFEIIIVVGT